MVSDMRNHFNFLAYESFDSFSTLLMFRYITAPTTEKTLVSFSGMLKISFKINSGGEFIMSYINTSGVEVNIPTGKTVALSPTTLYTVVFGFMKNKI